MDTRRKPRITYANVTSTLALVIAVGAGTAYASGGVGGGGGGVGVGGGPPINGQRILPGTVDGQAVMDGSLAGKELKKDTLTDQQMKPGSMSGDIVKPGTMDGDVMKLGTLLGTAMKAGSLPGSAMATGSTPISALDQLQLKAAIASSNAGTVDGKSATCQAGTLEYAGNCWETAVTPNTNWYNAVAGCTAKHGELPPLGALYNFTTSTGTPLAGEWVDDLAWDSTASALRTFKVSSGPGIQLADPIETHAYRCVLPLLHS